MEAEAEPAGAALPARHDGGCAMVSHLVVDVVEVVELPLALQRVVEVLPLALQHLEEALELPLAR